MLNSEQITARCLGEKIVGVSCKTNSDKFCLTSFKIYIDINIQV